MPDAGEPPLLEIDITRKHFRGAGRADVSVIAGLRFTLERGTVTCLLGPSGCGKTTALRIMLGLDRAYEGSIQPAHSPLQFGVVFQDPRLLAWRTVDENIRLAAPQASDAELVSLLSHLGLLQWRTHRPGELSVGMARRVAIARALAVKPDVLILDEAFVSLDERGADVLRAYVFETAREQRVTVLTVTHNIREALRYSDRILVLAPRPTHVINTFSIDRSTAARDDAWIDRERGRLIASNPGLQA